LDKGTETGDPQRDEHRTLWQSQRGYRYLSVICWRCKGGSGLTYLFGVGRGGHALRRGPGRPIVGWPARWLWGDLAE
jgi:hypothetical protein